jgi:hypothetical protein
MEMEMEMEMENNSVMKCCLGAWQSQLPKHKLSIRDVVTNSSSSATETDQNFMARQYLAEPEF